MKDKLKVIKSLAKFQEQCPAFIKDTKGFGYKYTTLPDIWAEITPLLRKHGLAVIQRNTSNEENVGVTTRVVHIESGEYLESNFETPTVELKGMNLYQSIGSAITYARRYDLSTLLGLQSEKDDDGGSGKQTGQIYGKKPKSLPKLPTSGEKFDKAVAYLKKGHTMDDLRKFYTITDEVGALLG